MTVKEMTNCNKTNLSAYGKAEHFSLYLTFRRFESMVDQLFKTDDYIKSNVINLWSHCNSQQHNEKKVFAPSSATSAVGKHSHMVGTLSEKQSDSGVSDTKAKRGGLCTDMCELRSCTGRAKPFTNKAIFAREGIAHQEDAPHSSTQSNESGCVLNWNVVALYPFTFRGIEG